MKKTDLATRTTAISSKLDEKIDDVVNNLTATITENDVEKLVKWLQHLTLQTKENSESLNKQDIVISSMKASYDERLEKMSINNIIKFETARKETE